MLITSQFGDVSETMESARRWSGFVCPDCRFVFRVPRDHDGQGIVCPSCRRILRIPAPGDTPPPLMAPLRRVVSGESGEDTAQAKTKKKRRGKKGAPDEEQEWARQGRGMRRGENTQMRLMLIGGTALFVLIVAGMIFATKSGKSSVNVPDLKSVSVEKNGSVTAPQAVRRSEAVIAYEAKVLAEKFTQATRVEAILPLVRHPEVAEARVRKFYPDGKIPVVGIALFNSGGAPVSHGSIVSFNIRTGDQEEKTMTFIDGPQGLKIDWESWVGWSDISWADFLSNKPSDAHVFRVTLAPIDYYNFDFNDDMKWQSYRLVSPDGEHAIYGYVEKSSLLDGRIRPNADVKSTPLMLSLKFPPGSTSSNQVLIDQFITEGWVEEKETP